MLEKPNTDEEVFALRHMALRNALYHSARRQWLEGWSRIFNFLIIVLGTSSAVSIINSIQFVSEALPLAIAVIGALQLVYDFSGKAKNHAFLQAKFYTLLASIDECVDRSNEQCASWKSEFSRIAADAPAVMRALDAVADNQATSTLLGGGPRLKVTYWEWLTRNLMSHNGSSFPPRKDWKALSAPDLI